MRIAQTIEDKRQHLVLLEAQTRVAMGGPGTAFYELKTRRDALRLEILAIDSAATLAQTPAQAARARRYRSHPTINGRRYALIAGGFIAGQNGMLSSTGMSEEFTDAVFEEQQAFSRTYGHPELSSTGNVFGPVFSMFCGL